MAAEDSYFQSRLINHSLGVDMNGTNNFYATFQYKDAGRGSVFDNTNNNFDSMMLYNNLLQRH